jgi:hypothetical protein
MAESTTLVKPRSKAIRIPEVNEFETRPPSKKELGRMILLARRSSLLLLQMLEAREFTSSANQVQS